MTTRTTRAELEQLARLINQTLGIVPHIDPEKSESYWVQGAYGRNRLVRNNGSVEVSPSLPAGELAQWMRAFHAGIVVGHQTAEKPVVLAEVSEGLILLTTVIRGEAEVIDIDWSNLTLEADNDNAVDEIDSILHLIDELGVADAQPGNYVGMPEIVRQLNEARTANEENR